MHHYDDDAATSSKGLSCSYEGGLSSDSDDEMEEVNSADEIDDGFQGDAWVQLIEDRRVRMSRGDCPLI